MLAEDTKVIDINSQRRGSREYQERKRENERNRTRRQQRPNRRRS